MAGVEYQVTKVDPTNPETKGMVYQVHKVTEEVAATMGGKVYRARIIKDPTEPTVAGKVYQIVLIGDPDDPSVKGKVYNAILTGDSEVVVVGPDVSPLSLPDAIANSLSYVKAFGGTEQRNIPQPYTQVNYVTNTASTAVDTGIMIDFAKNYEFEVECRAVSGSWYILQSRASASGNITGIHGATSGSTITLVVGNVTVCTSAITRTVGNKLYVKATLNAGTATLYVKDETANTEDTQTGSYGTSQPNPTAAVYLLGNAGGQYVDVNSDIYMARIKENDTVVMDYVPARQVAIAGFYDKASGTFKTALTPANLSADGNTVPTPTHPLDINCNNGVLKARHQSGLPLGYTLLEYIDTDGNSWIDTGITPTATTLQFDYKMQILQQDYVSLFGAVAATTPRYGFRVYYQPAGGASNILNWQSGSFGGQQSIVWDNVLQGVVIVTQGVSVVSTINGVTQSYSSSAIDLTQSDTMFLGTAHLGTTSGRAPTRIWSFKITKDGTVVRDFVPAKNASNVIGMYDFVSGQFFTNQGTGDFVAGSPINDPVEIYTDGTVETIEDTIGNIATAEMLLKVGDYQDVQSIIDGVVTRNVGVKVFDGTENWGIGSTIPSLFLLDMPDSGIGVELAPLCTHFKGTTVANINMQNGQIKIVANGGLRIKDTDYTTVAQFTQWLAAQYNAGTPVIVVYPLATPTTESVAGQTLQVQDGDNTLEITQASIDGLELEAEYEKEA